MNLNRQRGISLLSLMVATAIGIFLVGAILKIYADSKNTFNTRNTIAEVAENQRFALDDMRRILVMAGRDIRGIEDSKAGRRAFPPLTADQSAAIASGAEFMYSGDSSTSDVIAIRYRQGPSCGAYQNVPIGTRPSMVRFLVTDDNELVCELKTYGTGSGTTRQTLISGIHMLKALYGVDDDGDGYANRYLTAAKVNDTDVVSIPTGSNTPWAKVVSMRIGIIAGSESELPASSRKQTAGNLKLLGMSFTEPDTTHLYRAASTTLSLRNFNPIVQRQ
ncbi:PilW family protein [Thiolapillus sp.]